MDKKTIHVGVVAGFVYFSQGAVGIAGISLPLFLRNLEWSIGDITILTSIVSIPWVLKIIYGLLSDTVPIAGYRRKSYLFICAILGFIGWMSLGFVPATKSWIYTALIIANFGFAATDVITDGHIVENSTPKTSPLYQSIAWGARSLGAIVSGFTGGWLAANWNHRHVFMLTALLPLMVLAFLWMIDEQKKTAKNFSTVIEPILRCKDIIFSSNILYFIGILVIMTLPACFATPFFFHMKENLDFHEKFLGTLVSLGWTGALIGSFAYAKWLNKVSPKKILSCAILINVFNSWSTLLIKNEQIALILIFVGGVLGCIAILPMMSSAAILTHNSGVEGTVFAILMSLYNLGQILFGYLGGKLFPIVGLNSLIVGAGALILLGLIFVRRLEFEVVETEANSA